jgi:hypothetical protein
MSETELNIGGNLFSCPIPLVFKNRYFFVAKGDKEDIFSVFILKDGEPVFEVYENQPHDNPLTEVTKTPVGVITVSDKKSGAFMYKIRPGYKASSIFGRIKDKEAEIFISDRELRVGGTTLRDNSIQAEVGVILNDDGSTSIGATIPPEARHLFIQGQ